MTLYDYSRITRFEVIDETGRVYTKDDVKIVVVTQDNHATMKVLVAKRDNVEDVYRIEMIGGLYK